MYFFAHIFSGVLLGLGLMYLVHDRRALPVCILGSVLPDLLDKPLAFLFPNILGTSRTIGHSLFFFCLMVAAGVLLWHYRHTLLGLVFTGGVLSHHLLDSIWNLPGTWFFPLMGPFPVIIITDYVGHSFWLEFSSPSELVFALSSCIILVALYQEIVRESASPLMICIEPWLRGIMMVILFGMGIYLLYAGIILAPATLAAPAYAPLTNVMAGFLALCGAFVLARIPVYHGF